MSGHRTARVLVYTHRWMGILLGVLFVIWFVSGIVMMYARMPELSTADRLARLPAIVPDTVRVAPPLAKDAEITRLVINTIETRPVFRVTSQGKTRSFFADTGDAVPPTDSSQAVRIATQFHHGMFTLRYDERITDADQWSFGVRGRMPLHRLTAEDPDKTTLYVTENGGEVVLMTTQSGRFWGGAGAVLHWVYFTPFRRLSNAWNEFIVWTSIAGTIMCIVGIAWGLWRLSPLRGYRLRREPHWSPYAGWMRWHHYAGLIFGVVTTTWIFSGLLSMDPFDWHPSTSPTRDQRQRVSGGPIVAGELTPERLHRALKAFAPSWPKEVEIVKFRGHYFASAAAGIVSFDEPEAGSRHQLPADQFENAASLAMPGVTMQDMRWIDQYDSYYYDRDGGLSLPVLRVRYADPQQTWLYFDPRHGTIARKEERLTRLNRWLYHGLHSLDFPFLYYHRPLWDIVVIALSIGGIVLSITTISASWRRLSRHAKGITSGSRS